MCKSYFLYTKPSMSKSIKTNISSSSCSHFNLGRTTDHNMTKIESYQSLRRLFSAFLTIVFASRSHRFFLLCLCISGRKYKNDNVFFRCSFGINFHRGSTVGFLLLQCSSGVVRHPRDLQVSVATHFCQVLIFASS